MKTPYGQEFELKDLRCRLLRALIGRAKRLRLSQPPPENYFIGQEYVEDNNRIKCTITVSFIYPGLIHSTEFWHRKNRIVFQQHPPLLTIEIHREISGRLWDDLRLFTRGQQFIIGYVNAVMPAINRRLLDNRYLSGQPLSRTFFLLEAVGLFVTHGNKTLSLHWPVSISPFPRSAQLAPGRDETYLRDFIDAIHAYLKNDFDDCIRRLVTAAETFFKHRQWTATEGPNTFKRILDSNVKTDVLAGQVIVQNLKCVYQVRNKIAHRGFRMSPSSSIFCDKAVATVRYLIQGYSGDLAISKYAFSLGMQLLMLQNVLGNLNDLDDIERSCVLEGDTGPLVQNPSELDDFMFNSLRFTPQDRSSIL